MWNYTNLSTSPTLLHENIFCRFPFNTSCNFTLTNYRLSYVMQTVNLTPSFRFILKAYLEVSICPGECEGDKVITPENTAVIQ